MGIQNKYVINVVIFVVAFTIALGSKIPPCYLSYQQFLTFQTFLATANWVGYLKYMYTSLQKNDFLMAGK